MSYTQLSWKGNRELYLLALQWFEMIWNNEDQNNNDGKPDKIFSIWLSQTTNTFYIWLM